MSKRKIVEELKAQGKAQSEIVEITGLCKATVSYHCHEGVREKYRAFRRKNRAKFKFELKMNHGGKCSKCGYNKCLDALDFHHVDPSTKQNTFIKLGVKVSVTNLSHVSGQKAATAEAKKCILLCANCHRELHSAERKSK